MRGETELDKKRSEKLLEAIGELPEELVAEAADQQKIRRICEKNRRRRFLSVGEGLAAAALIGLVVWGVYAKGGMPFGEQSENLAEKKTVEFRSDSEKKEETDSVAAEDNTWSGSGYGKESASEGLGISFPSASAEGLPETGAATNDDRGDNAAGSDKNSSAKEQGDAAQKKNISSEADSKSGTGMDNEKSAVTELENSLGENDQNNPIIVLHTSWVEKGKGRVVQSEMVLGEAGEKKKYHLTASKGISFLTAAALDQDGKKVKKEKVLGETGKYRCLSGTQITFSLPVKGRQDTDIAVGMPSDMRASWREIGITAVGYIQVRVGEGIKGKQKGTIYIGKQKERYYAEIAE